MLKFHFLFSMQWLKYILYFIKILISLYHYLQNRNWRKSFTIHFQSRRKIRQSVKSPKEDCNKNFQRSSSTSVNSKYSQNTCRDRKIQRRRRRRRRKLSCGKFSLQEGQTIDVSCEKLKRLFFFFFTTSSSSCFEYQFSRIKYGNIFSSWKTDVCADERTRGNGRALDIDPSRAFLERSFNRKLSFFRVIHPTLIQPFLSPLNPVSRVSRPEFLGLMFPRDTFIPISSRDRSWQMQIFPRSIKSILKTINDALLNNPRLQIFLVSFARLFRPSKRRFG